MGDHLTDLNTQAQKHRSALADAVTDLAASFAPDALKAEAQARAMPLVDTAIAQARRNPAALAVLGAGVALFLAGPGKSAPRSDGVDDATAPGLRQPGPAYAGQDARIEAAAKAMKSQEMSRHLGSGLDRLPPAARKRVMQARRAALDAQRKLERHAASLEHRTAQDPATFGAIALVAGAVIGALLPGTRREDDLLGETRDALVREAEESLRAEAEQLGTSADTAIRDVLSEHGKDARA